MRRNKALTRGPTLPVLAAGLIGYLIGGWHPAALRTHSDLSAADSVALRFPQSWDAASPVATADDAVPGAGVLNDAGATTSASANWVSDAQLALLNPEPMVPQLRAPPVSQTSQEPAPQPRMQLASVEDAVPLPALDPNATRQPVSQQVIAARPQRPIKASAVAVQRRPMNRSGYMLDDAQIASIKERLHLTLDQEQMWPAVEAALRNVAYTRARQAHERGVSGNTQTAGIDPESVQGLKSAAVPLIMSFNDEQKQEVRNLAHVMGLDQLAAQF